MCFQGGTGSEKALFMRLHLLQGIVAFHQGHTDKANALLNRVCTSFFPFLSTMVTGYFDGFSVLLTGLILAERLPELTCRIAPCNGINFFVL